MIIEIFSIDQFHIMAESDSEIALLDHWNYEGNITLRDVSSDDKDGPKTLECIITKRGRNNNE